MNIVRHSAHLSTPILALQRIFLPILSSPTPPIHLHLLLPPTPQHQHRQKRFQARPRPNSTPTSPTRLQDEQITAPLVQLVSAENNSLLPPEPPQDILRRLDRTTSILLQVTPNKHTPDFTPRFTTTTTRFYSPASASASASAPSAPPVVKILSKKDLENQSQQQQHQKRPPASRQTKRLEFSWLIDENDLRHKLSRLRTFLAAGRRVEIALEDRRRQRVSTPEDRERLLAELRAFVAGCEGGREWKGMATGEGPRSSATLFFEGVEGKEGKEEERVDEGGKNGEEEERVDERGRNLEEEERVEERGRNLEEEERVDERGRKVKEERVDERGRKGKKLWAKKRGGRRRDGDGEDVD